MGKKTYDKQAVTGRNSKPTRMTVERQGDPSIAMRLPMQDLDKLKKMGDEIGVPTAVMGRILLLQKIRHPEK